MEPPGPSVLYTLIGSYIHTDSLVFKRTVSDSRDNKLQNAVNFGKQNVGESTQDR